MLVKITDKLYRHDYEIKGISIETDYLDISRIKVHFDNDEVFVIEKFYELSHAQEYASELVNRINESLKNN